LIGTLKILLHRSLGQDDGRGLMRPAIDSGPSNLKIWLVWGHLSTRHRMSLTARIFGLQAPLVVLRGECAKVTPTAAPNSVPTNTAPLSPDEQSDECERARWSASYQTAVSPLD